MIFSSMYSLFFCALTVGEDERGNRFWNGPGTKTSGQEDGLLQESRLPPAPRPILVMLFLTGCSHPFWLGPVYDVEPKLSLVSTM